MYMNSPPPCFSKGELMAVKTRKSLKVQCRSPKGVLRPPHLFSSPLLEHIKQEDAVHKNYQKGALLSHQNCMFA